MVTTRKDLRRRTLRKDEMQRSSDKRYAYSYTDPLGRRKYIYTNDLVTLREKEAQLTKDQMDGLDIYVSGKATVNFVFDRYMSLKTNLRQTTQSNYLYMYDRFIRDTFGKKKIAEIKYSRCASVLQLSAGQARLARRTPWKAFIHCCTPCSSLRSGMRLSAKIRLTV